ncbi:conserved hypothetical protein [Candidatus Nitrosotenuis uzonensis]|uniref:Uncharacterized protein n=1 Tax=Candidatus Nitrosotenuis uzonensis TaxID=1407055 RepID=A0A812EXE5_9ARCH|nr:conserved hypothetical protein [Candidatus Nitrosotenuis uzonensis]
MQRLVFARALMLENTALDQIRKLIIKIWRGQIIIFTEFMVYVPLSNNVIMHLNEMTTQIHNKKLLSENDEQLIRGIFNKILEQGEWYDVNEIESWLENEGTWTHKPTIIRITNISHYIQTRFQQRPAKLKMLSDDGCG